MPADAPRATAADRHSPGTGEEGDPTAELATPASQAAVGDPLHRPDDAWPRGDDVGSPGDGDDDFAALLAEGRAGGSSPAAESPWALGAGTGYDPSGAATEAVVRTPDPGPAPVLTPGSVPDPAPLPDLPAGPSGPGDPVPRPGGRPPRRGRGGRGRQGRKVRQRLWAIDPWSVFKISVMFYACMFVIMLVAGTVLWNVARSAGTIDEVESFVTRLAAYGECVPEEEVPKGTEFSTDDDCEDEGGVLINGFQVHDDVVFRIAAITGAVFAVAGSLANVLMVVLLNLINEISGGMRYTIIREPTRPKRPGFVRRGVRSLTAKAKR